MKIVILDGHAVNPGDLSWDFLNQFGDVTVYERTALEEVAQRIGDAEIVLTNKSPINEEILKFGMELDAFSAFCGNIGKSFFPILLHRVE